MPLPEPTPSMLQRIFDLYRPNLGNLSLSIEWKSKAHARLLYEALARFHAELQALYAMPQAEAEAAATALRLQAQAAAQAAAEDKRDRPAESKS